MKHLNQILITNNLTLKVISLIMGYSFWFIWSQTQITSYHFDVPLCVYNIPENAAIKAPETVTIELAGTLQDLHALDLNNLAVHVDGATLHEGTNQCFVKNEQLFVPETIKMKHYAPSNILISYNNSTSDCGTTTELAHASADQAPHIQNNLVTS